MAVLLMAACSDEGSASTTTTTEPKSVATTTTTRPDDGVLVIGALLPSSGAGSELGRSLADAITVAISEVNAAGGVNGQRVRLITAQEGDSTASAALALQDLVQRGVDAIVGPASSITTLATLGSVVDAGVLTCSPTASALALDDFPDEGLFFRTIPSDSLQARAIALAVEASGKSRPLVVYIDDAYGRPFAQAVEVAIAARGGTVTSVGFMPNERSIEDAVTAIAAQQPDVIAVVADDTSGPAMIAAIDALDSGRISYIVNDSMRHPAAAAPSFSDSLTRRIVGVAPLALAGSAGFDEALAAVNQSASGIFAHNAYDCVSIIALAAKSAGSSQPRAMAGSIVSVAASGTACGTFTACSSALEEGRNINYNGPSGNLSIDANGNVLTVDFERFVFDSTGRDVPAGKISVGSG